MVLSIFFITNEKKFVIDLNQIQESKISVNATHVQVRIEDYNLPFDKLKFYISFSDLNNVIEELQENTNYCKNQYHKNANKCNYLMSYEQFSKMFNEREYKLPLLENNFTDEDNNEKEPCGFCDYLFYSLDREFSLRGHSKHYTIHKPQPPKDLNTFQNRLFGDNCKLNRVLYELVATHENY